MVFSSVAIPEQWVSVQTYGTSYWTYQNFLRGFFSLDSEVTEIVCLPRHLALRPLPLHMLLAFPYPLHLP